MSMLDRDGKENQENTPHVRHYFANMRKLEAGMGTGNDQSGMGINIWG